MTFKLRVVRSYMELPSNHIIDFNDFFSFYSEINHMKMHRIIFIYIHHIPRLILLDLNKCK